MKLLSLFIISISIAFCSCASLKHGTSKEEAKEYIQKYVIKNDTSNYKGKLISKRKALHIAKQKVYETFGNNDICRNEKPFKKYFIGNYLYLSGTKWKISKGGLFWIVIDRRNGEIKSLGHGK